MGRLIVGTNGVEYELDYCSCADSLLDVLVDTFMFYLMSHDVRLKTACENMGGKITERKC